MNADRLKSGAPAAALTRVPRASRAASHRRIVVALRDAELSARVLETLAKRFPFVEQVSDGCAAFEVCTADPTADLLVCDLTLPKLDVLELLRRLRRVPAAPRVILTGATAAESAVSLALTSGASDFLFQPFTDLELLARARAHVLARDAERRAADHIATRPAVVSGEPYLQPGVLSSMLMSAPVGFCLLDTSFHVLRINRRLATIAGRALDACLGRPIDSVLGPDVARVLEVACRRALLGHTISDVAVTTFDPKLGRRYHVASFYPVRLGNELIGVGIMMDDRTDTICTKNLASDSHAKIVEMNEVKDRFLAVISHELRTPLAAIELWSHALLTGPQNEATLARGLGSIRASAAAQSRLIQDLLDLSRAVTGKLSLVPGTVHLGTLVEHIVDSVHLTLAEKAIRLVRKVPRRLPLIPGDAARLEQVLWNLINNAILFTPSKGVITVEAVVLRRRIVVRVTDTGPGIAEDVLPFVFEPFRQGKGQGSLGGLGLGLTVAKHIIELHDGTIECASEPGRGATFTFALPRSA